MSLNPVGTANYSWNYSKPEKEDYSLELWGTVVSLQEIQARTYNPGSNQPGQPRFWDDGNPMMNIRMGLAMPDGRLKAMTFQKAGKKQSSGEKPSIHMDLFRLTNGNMMDLIGKTLHIITWSAHPGFDPRLGADENGVPRPWNNDAKKNQLWMKGNPRLFAVELVEGVTYQLSAKLPDEFTVPELLCNNGASGGQPNGQPTAPAPQNMQAPQVPPMQGQYYSAPQATPPAPVSQQAPAPAPASAPMPAFAPAAAAPMPTGMDPAVAAAMQAAGAVNVQPVTDGTGGVYDDQIPF